MAKGVPGGFRWPRHTSGRESPHRWWKCILREGELPSDQGNPAITTGGTRDQKADLLRSPPV